jgi:hypothetical protein
MKKALKETTLFMLVGALVFLFAGCDNQAAGDDGSNVVLTGYVSINLASETPGTQLTSTITGIQLTAAYSGPETDIYYQWKRGEIKVGANSKFFTPDTSGIYTVSVSGNKNGRNPITSDGVSVYAWNGGRPIITSSQTAAPSAHVWDGRLYLYPATDIDRASGAIMDQYHVFSTNNMVNWIDHGEILRRSDLNDDVLWGAYNPSACFMLPPDAAYRTGVQGKGPYFFYFPLDFNGENSWTIGAAWSDKPYNGFKTNVVRLKNSDGSYVSGDKKWVDPCIFRNGEDYYLVTGGSTQLCVAKLNNDMVSLSEALTPYADMAQLPHYNGGPWMFTRNGIFYLMYSGNPSGGDGGDELLYAVSQSVSGPWDYKGSILDPSGTGSTSQGSVAEFNGKWYLFYHNAKLSEGEGDLRSVCVDELFFNPNGGIQKVVQTAAGVAQNGPKLTTAQLDSLFGAGNYSEEVDYSEIENGNFVKGYAFVRTILAMDSSVVVGGGAEKRTNDIPAGAIHDLHLPGAYAEFTGITGDGGKALIRLSYAIAGSATIQVRVNGAQGKTLSLPDTGGWAVVGQSGFLEITLNSGSNTIRFSGAGVNIASMSLYQEK